MQEIFKKLENSSTEQEMQKNKDEYMEEWLGKINESKDENENKEDDEKEKKNEREKEYERWKGIFGINDSDTESNDENVINIPEILSPQESEISEKVSEQEEIQNSEKSLTFKSNQTSLLISENTSQSSVINLENLFNMAATTDQVKRMLERALGLANNALDNPVNIGDTVTGRIVANYGGMDFPTYHGKEDEDLEEWINQFDTAFNATG